MPDQPAQIPKLRWYQYRLRTLLLLVTAVAIFFSWFAVKMNQARRQKEIVDQFSASQGVRFQYDYECGPGGIWIPNSAPSAPAWLVRWLGRDFFADVVWCDVAFSTERKNDDADLLEALAKLPQLQYLISDRAVDDEALRRVGKLKNLRSLRLRAYCGTRSGIDELRNLTRLHNLELNLGPDVPDAEIEPLRNLNQLKYLNLSGAELTDAALRPPSDLPHLQDLWITIDNFSGDGLRHLSKLTQLQELHIASSSETANINLEHLARLPQLRLLDIRCKNWDRQSESKERGSLHLAKMDTLENLVIQGDLRVDDANLDVLADCPRLKQLGIEDNRLTDASIPHLKKLSRIEAMAILSTRISETGAAELKKVQPDAYIDIKGGGPGMF